MLQLTPQMKIFISLDPIDFRKGIDRVAQICREKFLEDPFSGKVFMFTSKNYKSIKILVYDGQGFWLMQKRLSRGHFEHWPKAGQRELSAQEVSVLLWNGSPTKSGIQSSWRQIE